jgi:type II secretory pathway component PulJ
MNLQPGTRFLSRRRTLGVTLVELLVGLVVGLIVLLAVLGIYLATVRASSDTMQGMRLNQDLRAAMMVITSDLRRAGYWNQALNASNPFRLQETLGFRIPDASCVRYEYDRNQDGVIDREFESFGFWFDGGVIRMLADPEDTQVLTRFNECSKDVGEWIDLAGDDALVITALTFSDEFQCRNVTEDEPPDLCPVVEGDAEAGNLIVQIRQVDITLSGQVGPHSMTIEETVRLRNDRRFRYEP